MIQYISAILLFFSISLQSFDKAIVVLDYYVRPSTFAKNCENKSLPKMHCGGKCQMMKKLKEKEKQEFPEGRLAGKTVVFSPMNVFAVTPNVEADADSRHHSPISIGHPVGRSLAVFRPPSQC
jgi:hypothetical protein